MNKKSRTSLFLMEMIISILLFSVTSAVCTQLFVQTHLKQEETRRLQFAQACAQNIAELSQSDNGADVETLFHQILTIYPSGQRQDKQLTLYFNDAHQNCESTTESVCFVQIQVQMEDHLRTVIIEVHDVQKNNEIYHLTIEKHIRNRLISERSEDEENEE